MLPLRSQLEIPPFSRRCYLPASTSAALSYTAKGERKAIRHNAVGWMVNRALVVTTSEELHYS